MAVHTTDESVPLESAFNPYDTVFMTDPDAVLARARDQDTIFFSPILGAWIVTRYDHVVSVLRDPELFCSKEILSITELLSPEVIELFGDQIPMEGTLIGVDPPDHTRLRSVMESSFTASAVASHEAMIRYACEELVDGFANASSADLLSQFSYPLPLRVVALLLGFPKKAMRSLRRGVREWPELAIALLMGVPLDQQLTMAHNILEMHRMITRLLEERYVRPQNDLLTIIARGRDEFNLSEREMLSLVPGLFLAGHETLAHELTNVLWRLLSMPERWDALVKDPSLGPQFFDEALRCDPSVYGMWRIATRDTELLVNTSPPVRSSFSSTSRPIATSATTPTRIRSRSIEVGSPRIWPSDAASITALARRWPDSKPASRWRSSRRDFPDFGWPTVTRRPTSRIRSCGAWPSCPWSGDASRRRT